MSAIADSQAPAPAQARYTRRALSSARGHLQQRALNLLVWLLFGYLVLKLVPDLREALRSLEHVGWRWVVGMLGLEVLSAFGFATSWRAIVDPDNVVRSGDGRGARISTEAAWAQLGGGMVLPGGSLASIGVGAWILRRLGMAPETIAERQLNLSFLNTATDALVLIVAGVALATGVVAGERNLLLTLVPAAIAAAAIALVLLVSRRATTYSEQIEPHHPKLASGIASLAHAVAATARIVFNGDRRSSLLGALAYLGFDVLVLWTALSAVHTDPVPGFAAVVMAYIIGALGGSIPLPAGIGAAGGIAGMLVIYGVGRNAAVAAVLLYQAVGLLVPLAGGAVSYLLLRHELGPMRTLDDSA